MCGALFWTMLIQLFFHTRTGTAVGFSGILCADLLSPFSNNLLLSNWKFISRWSLQGLVNTNRPRAESAGYGKGRRRVRARSYVQLSSCRYWVRLQDWVTSVPNCVASQEVWSPSLGGWGWVPRMSAPCCLSFSALPSYLDGLYPLLVTFT